MHIAHVLWGDDKRDDFKSRPAIVMSPKANSKEFRLSVDHPLSNVAIAMCLHYEGG